MNHTYRLIWNDAMCAWVAVAEFVRAQSKGGTVLLAAAALAAVSASAYALPTGGQVSAGSGSIVQAGGTLTVKQQSQNLAVNWQSFNVGAAETVNFVQPGTSAIALNRVLGSDSSQILGHLNANGQVWLLNPNGVLFGNGAQVSVGGLVASTLGISDADFLAGKRSFSGTGGSVVNQGNIGAGYVALLGGQVKNEGVIVANLGTAALAAGNAVTLDFDGDKLLNVQVDAGALYALADNKGLVQADGGTVIMTAKAKDALFDTAVNNSGVVRAQTIENRDGRILLLGDLKSGTVNVGGTLDASAPNGGNGGSIETSAARVNVADAARVTTLAPNGKSGTWLIDPDGFTIAASGGNMTGTAVGSALAGGNFTVQSTSGSGSSGNIDVNDSVTWSAHTLTLHATNNINFNTAMNGSGTAALALEYGQGAVAAGNTSNYFVNAAVNLPAGPNFSTRRGSDGVLASYIVITDLGAAGSTTTADLQGINGMLSANYVLGANIDAAATSAWNSGAGFLPVGTSAAKFTGTLDGLGHTITGLTINRPGTDDIGLFGVAGAGSTIRNLGVGGNISATGLYAGMLAGESYGTITNSYATGSVGGTAAYVGGLVGVARSGASVQGSYATDSATGRASAGGLIGYVDSGAAVANSYATGSATATGSIAGGLAAENYGAISYSYATGAVGAGSNPGGLVGSSSGTVTASFWDTQTSGKSSSAGGAGAVGKTTAEMKSLATFTGSGWDIDAAGGTGKTWRIYDGYTTPLLRGLLTPLTVQPTYDGSGAAMTNIGAYSISGSYDGTKVLGTVANSLTLSSTAANAYTATLSNGLYSTQTGYDINVVNRAINTPGSAAGDIALSAPISWTSGTLNINTTGTITDTAVIGGSGTAIFNLQGGTWRQVSATLPAFSAYDFRISGGNFVRALSGNGTSGTPFHLADIYGVQGMGSSGLLGAAYTLGNDVDASATAAWNAGAGFAPVGTNAGYFVGSLDGQGHTIGGLTINRGTTDYVGLFGYAMNATLSNIGLTAVAIAGRNDVGGLAGAASGGVVAGSYAGGTVAGTSTVGGLVGLLLQNGVVGNSYATGSVGGNIGGGLIGSSNSGIVNNSFAAASVSGTTIGGLVGQSTGGTATSSFWDKTLTPTDNGIGSGKTTAEMKSLATFGAWTIDDVGGSGKTWRIYDGYTYPLLRTFLTPLTVQPAYDGSGAALTNIGAYTISGSYDGAKVLGAAPTSLTLASSAANAYTATLSTGLYSTQAGYDIYNSSRAIATPGSAAGDIALNAPITWASGTLYLNATGTISDSAAIGFTGAAIFNLQNGTWRQVSSTLPAFAAYDFRISGGTFIRALSGDGTAGSPYRLADIYGVQGMGSVYNTLGADVDASITATWNGGAGFAPLYFTGNFDGLGHTIAGLTINRPTTNNVGLFGQAGKGSVIANLGLTGGSVTGKSLVGGLAGVSYAAISNSYNTGAVNGYSAVGGLVGYNYHAIVTSHADGAVTATSSGAGGLAGGNSGLVSGSHATGAVSATGNVGGLVGTNASTSDSGSFYGYAAGSVDNSYAIGNVTATGTFVDPNGGDPLNMNPLALLTNCAGSSGCFAGGLVGFNGGNGGAITDSYATGNVTDAGGAFVGGLAGANVGYDNPHVYYNSIVNSHATGNVSSSGVGGNGGEYVGGLVGLNMLGTIAGSYATGAVSAGNGVTSTGATSGHSIGGLVGANVANENSWTSTISGSYATGAVTTNAGYEVGGLVGLNFGDGGITPTIRTSYATGAVSNANGYETGGLVGRNSLNGLVTDCYATGAVSGLMFVGGLAGTNLESIGNSYSTGAVSGTQYVGGLVSPGSVGVTNSYWDIQTSGQGTAGVGVIGVGLTTAQMKQLATFGTWDIDNAAGTGKTWRIYDGSTYPLLRSFLTPLTVQPAYDGSGAALTDIGAVAPVGTYDASKVFAGAAAAGTLTLASTAANGYTATASAANLYSTQSGYDIALAPRTIATPGSAAGDIALSNPISWTGGTLAINTSGTITDTAAINGTGSAVFNLQSGTWYQLAASLPAFAADDFRISGGRFYRATGGNGSSGGPLLLVDIYGVQGIGSGAMLNLNYKLAGDIDATGTAHWNGGAGFVPIGTSGTPYIRSFDGQGHTISGLVINRPTTDYVGLFGYLAGTVRNLGLVGGSVSGRDNVGAVAGFTGQGSISGSFASAAVAGRDGVGGLAGVIDNGAAIADSYASGAVTGTNNVGGLAGAVTTTSSIARSYATGVVVGGNSTIGGLVGYNGNGTIGNSYATGNASGLDIVGGLVGMNSGGTVTNSYATGHAASTDNVGGLVGNNAGTVTGSFWDVTTSNNPFGIGAGTASGATGKTAVEMKQLATFSGWDIDAAGGTGKVWRSYDGYTAPLLRGFLTPLTVTANNTAKTYDGLAYSGGNGIGYSIAPNANLLGSASYGGTAQGAVNAGSYSIAPAGLYSSQQGYDVTYANGTLTVNAAPLTVTANGTSKTYDSLAWSGGNGVAYSGFVNSETAAVLGGNLSYGGNSQGAKNAGSYVIAPGGLTSGNYTIAFINGTLTVNKAPLTLTTADVVKTYDGTNAANGSLQIASGTLFGSDSFSGGYFAFTDKDAGGNKTVTVSGVAVSDGNGGGNYNVAYTANSTSTINKAPLTVTANNDAHVYDGNAYSGGNGVSYSGFVAGENSSVLGGTLAYGGSSQGATNAGSYAIAPSGLTAANYAIAYADGTLTISPAGLTLLGVGADDKAKTYGAADPALTWRLTSGSLVSGDSISGSLARDAGENVGQYAIRQGSLTAGANYVISFANGILTISPAPLTVTANNAAKTYDGLAYGGGNGVAYSGFVNGETAAVLGGSLSYGGNSQGAKNAGSYVVAPAGLTSANYAITFTDGTLTIGKAPLTVTANNDAHVYDGNAYSGGNGVGYSGFVAGENSSVLGGTLAYGGSSQGATNAGSYAIAPSGLTAANYAIAYADGTLTISPAGLTLLGVGADDKAKTYGAADPALTWRLTSGSLVSGDSISGSLARDAGENVGQYAIRQGSLTAGANYVISFANGILTISPAPLTVTANNAAKTYDGLAYGGGNGVAYSGFVNGETAAVLGGTLAYGGSSQGAINAGSYVIVPSGLTSSNYAVAFANGTLTVGKAHLTVTADNQSRLYGQANPGFTETITGYANGEDAASAGVSGSASGSSAATTTTGVGSYMIAGSTGTLSAANYDFTPANGTLTIGKAHLTVTADNQARLYGQVNPGFSETLTGFMNGENATSAGVSGTAAGSSAATTASGVGSYAITGSSGTLSAANYDFTPANGTLTIGKAHLTVTADNQARLYGQANPGFSETLTGFMNGENAASAGVSGTAAGSSAATTASGVGSYMIAGSTGTLSAANYDFTPANGTLTIGKAHLTVTADNQARLYGQVNPGFSETLTGFMNGENATSAGVSGTAAGSSAATTASGVGSYAITGSSGTLSAANYDFTPANGTLTIGKAHLTVTADNQARLYGQANPGFSETLTGFMNGENAASAGVSGTAAGSSAATTASGVGSYMIAGSTGTLSAANYDFTPANGTLTIGKAHLTVTADNQARLYGQVNPGFSETLTGFMNGENATSAGVSGTAAGSSAATTASDVGSYAITGSSGTLSAANYDFAAANGTLTIGKVPLTVTAADDSKTYDGRAYSGGNGVGYSGFVNGETFVVLGGTLAYGGSAQGAVNLGRYVIAPAGLTSGNYAIHFVDGTLAVVVPETPAVPGTPADGYSGALAATASIVGGNTIAASTTESSADTPVGVPTAATGGLPSLPGFFVQSCGMSLPPNLSTDCK